MTPLRVFVADHQPVVLQLMTAALATQPGMEVCGEASDGPDAVAKVLELRPDIALLDLRLPTLNGLEATRQIVQSAPNQKVILLTDTGTERRAREIFLAGGHGFLLRENLPQDLIPALEAVQQGRTVFTIRHAKRFLKGYLKGGGSYAKPEGVLSGREHEIIQALAKEVAFSMTYPRRSRETHPFRKYVLTALLLIACGVAALLAFTRNSDQVLSQVDQLLVALGIKASPPPAYGGNPDIRVWVDVHTALYYCPGTPLYGKTPNGHYVKQRDAVQDHFEPAERKGCN